MDLPASNASFGIGGIVPVHPGMMQQLQDPRRHVDHWMPVLRTGLEQDDPCATLAQPVCQDATGRASADDHIVCDEIGLSARHLRLSRSMLTANWVPCHKEQRAADPGPLPTPAQRTSRSRNIADNAHPHTN